MNIPLVYKEFGTIKEFKQHLNKYNPIFNTSYIQKKTYWKRDEYGFYLSYSYSYNNSVIFESNIGTISNFYFYIDKVANKVYSIFADEFDYRSFENKLYHLTHGPKALSIPDAFKVLSL